MTTPYYENSGVTIYNGDCREILPELAPCDVVMTDPPWKLKKANPEIIGCDRAIPLWKEVVSVLSTKRLLLWLPIHADPREWLVPIPMDYLRLIFIRRAIPSYYGRVLLDGEIVHALGEWPKARKGRMVIPGGIPSGMTITYTKSDRMTGHPGPRSYKAALFIAKWWTDPGEIVLDPFMGSGTTLVAAKAMGCRAIGIELCERYCEMTANRLSQEVFDFTP